MPFFRRAMSDMAQDGRTIRGLIVPYNKPTEVSDWGQPYKEQFAPGSLADAVASPRSVKFMAQHDREAFPIGVVRNLTDDPEGVHAEMHVSETPRGDEFLTLVRDGAVDGFSVGFESVDPAPDYFPQRGELVTRKKAFLREVSGVTWPAYPDARISGVRAEGSTAGVETCGGSCCDPGCICGDCPACTAARSAVRVGKTLSAATTAELRAILTLINSSDEAVDEALVRLSTVLGVPNPDSDAHHKSSGPGEGSGGRGYSTALVERAIRRLSLTSSRRAGSAATSSATHEGN